MLNDRAMTKVEAVIVAVIVIVAVVASVYFARFYPSGPTPEPEEEIKNPDTIMIESYREINILNPITVTMASEALACWNIYEGLTTLRGNQPGEADPLPGIAESWSVSDDGMTWTFNLREDAKFSNGDPIDADAVKWNFDRLTAVKCPNSWYLYGGIISEGCCQVIDPNTVEITTDISFPAFTSLLCLWTGMVNPDIVEDLGGYGTDTCESVIATGHPYEGLYSGPYKVAEFVPGTGGHVKLEANPQYWGEQPKTKYVHIEWTPEVSTRILKLKKGDTDYLWRFPVVSVSELLGAEGVTIEVPGASWAQHFLIFSGLDPLGMDENGKLVRQALCYSFPYDTILTYVYAGYATRSIGPVPFGSPGAQDYITDRYNFNLTKAAELLDQAGYTADPDTGERLELEVDYAVGAEERKQAIIIWQSECDKIGVKLKVREVAWKSITDRMRSGEVDVSASQWYPDYADPYHFCYSLLHSYSVYGIPGSSWNITEVDDLIDTSLNITDKDERFEMLEEAQEISAKDPGRIYIAQESAVYIHRDWLKGYEYNPILHCDFSTLYKSLD